MPIEIYPSKLAGGPLEVHQTDERMTLEAWLRAKAPSFEHREAPPISISVNGCRIPPACWSEFRFRPEDRVAIYIEPAGAELVIAAVTLQAAVKFVTGLFMPKMPKMPSSPGQGDKMSEAAAKGNQIKINSPIREIAGRRKVYPDYLLPPHRYFQADDPKSQWVELMLCIGKGRFQINSSEIQVGDTPIVSLGGDAEYQIYQPDADLSVESAAVWWHSATEVGSTSSGTAGLELRATYEVDPVAEASSYTFSGDTIAVPDGAGSFPDGWSTGMIVRIEQYLAYTVGSDGGSIQGHLEQLEPFAGMVIEIAGDIEGAFVVHEVEEAGPGDPTPVNMTLNYLDGSPVVGLPSGSKRLAIGYDGMRYRITSTTVTEVDDDEITTAITVDRLTDTGATDTAWVGFSSETTSDAVLSLDASTQEGDWAGPFAACPDGEVTQLIECDFFFPGGLVRVSNKGALRVEDVTVEIQYRDIETAGAWTSVTKNYAASTLDQIGFSESIALPAAYRPEVRVRRIGAKPTNPNIQETCQWYGLRAKLRGPTSYAGVTTIAMRIRGGYRLASQSEQLVSVIATRMLPVRSGGAWLPEAPTRNIAPWVAYVAKSIGYTDDDIDFDELDRLDAIWSERGDNFDAVVDSSGTVKEWLNDAFAAGFAELTIDRGRIRPARDEPRSAFEHMYTPQNMTEGPSRQFAAIQPDDYDGVDVEYTSSVSWQKETVECRLPGDIGQRVEKLKLEGVTDETRAWRIGMRRRMEQLYRRWTYSWGTELDALNSRYLSYCAVGDDVPGYGQSALLMSVETVSGGYLLEPSEPLTWGDGSHVVALRRPDGTLSGPYTATRIDDYRLAVPELDFTPDTSWQIEPPHLLFGPLNRWSYPVLITSISPSGDGASVEAVNYDPRIYEYDDAFPA
ncbi:host specificity factor TipJ family phage tail protein [Azotobacter vinelandii]|uniref:host specificity factor TipJ family phage tail protein n=1 Tax=Azotobacter vinelandii TaxID=354 RepID=UPI00091EFD5C|nr:host specificity factor TipJ family phage tail protein [Azotobacter vinelandii]SFY16034.1 Putative phage tail protein [Azotobacter vinelandii]